MAKKRFPSDANKSKEELKAPKSQADAPSAPEKVVEGKKLELVKLSYKLKNHHLLNHVVALHPGENHVCKLVWEKAKSQPAIQRLLKDGHLVDLSDACDEQEAEQEEDQDLETKSDQDEVVSSDAPAAEE